MTSVEIRQHCRRYAEKFIDVQREEFKRLGVFGEWEDPYLTMNYRYQATIVRELGQFLRKRLRVSRQEAGLLVRFMRYSPG